MKTFLMLLLSLTALAQDSLPPATNPLANVLPAPVPKYTEAHAAFDRAMHNLPNRDILPVNTGTASNMSFQDKMNILTLPPDAEYSQNYKDYLSEQANPSPLKNFEDNKVKFNDYSKPTLTIAIPDNEPEKESSTNIIGMIFGLLCVFLTFIILLFSKRTKRY